jgi:hypothetical protein
MVIPDLTFTDTQLEHFIEGKFSSLLVGKQRPAHISIAHFDTGHKVDSDIKFYTALHRFETIASIIFGDHVPESGATFRKFAFKHLTTIVGTVSVSRLSLPQVVDLFNACIFSVACSPAAREAGTPAERWSIGFAQLLEDQYMITELANAHLATLIAPKEHTAQVPPTITGKKRAAANAGNPAGKVTQPAAAKPDNSECRFFTQGKCTRRRCPFLHNGKPAPPRIPDQESESDSD